MLCHLRVYVEEQNSENFSSQFSRISESLMVRANDKYRRIMHVIDKIVGINFIPLLLDDGNNLK